MTLFNAIKNELSILDVIGEAVQLRPAGHYWKSSCPFHSETDASFTVSPEKQIFYCFGCHAHGDVIGFVARKENLTQLEAARHLVDRYHLKISDELAGQFSQVLVSSKAKESYFLVCSAFAEWAHERLFHHRLPHEYLIQRNLSEETIKLFRLGYFPGGNISIKQLIRDLGAKNILVHDLIDAGILQEGKSSLYSPFEERIIFPIADGSGRMCGFGGRIFKSGDDRSKYYNSKENEGFIKGRVLFGLDLAKKSIQEKQSAFLVEGYMDCITMAQHGYTNTVATLGTACTVEHLKIISRLAPRLFVLYDGDQAGQNAIMRLTELCWEVCIEPFAIILPKGEDPASLLSNDVMLDNAISSAKDIFSFFVEHNLGLNFYAKPLGHKLQLMEKVLQLLAKIGDPLKKDLLLQQASSITNIPFSSLKESLRRIEIRQQKWRARDNLSDSIDDVSNESCETEAKDDDIKLLEEKIISVILTTNLQNGGDGLNIEPDLLVYFSDQSREIVQKFFIFKKNENEGPGDFGGFLETLNDAERVWVIRVSLLFNEEVGIEIFNQLVFCFCKYNWKNIVRGIKAEMLRATEEKNSDRLNELFRLFSKLKQGIQSRGLI